MKAFFVGLLVLLVFMLLSIAAIFLLPLIVVLGFFMKLLISAALLIVAIWLLGKAALWAIDRIKEKGENKP